ncbi:MAG: hypothetical protein ACQGVC_05030 [Myxococcota bacterium]
MSDGEGGRDRRTLGLVLLAALAVYAWNVATHEPFAAYDLEGHMHYVATLVDLGRLPEPLEGWSSFHPPLYYALLAGLSLPAAPVWPVRWLEGVSVAAVLVVGASAFRVLRRLGHARPVAALAALVLLFLPSTQLAGTMVGNEALAAGFAALAALLGVGLHADPRSLPRAAGAALCVGLAMATKFTGLLALPAVAVPFLRRDVDRALLVAAGVAAAIVLVLASGPYLRNWRATGEWLPMTRDREPVATVERGLTIRERRVVDYLWLDPAVFRLPTVHALAGGDGKAGLNPVMTNVWGLAYASAWYDAHEVRVPEDRRAAGARVGRGLLVLGVVPTLLLLLGAGVSLRRTLRGSDPGAPLVGMAALGALAFVGFTLRAPATAAVKASYLLPCAVPAALFFARGLEALPAGLRRAGAFVSGTAALACAVAFASGVWLPVHAAPERARPAWLTPDLARVTDALDAASAGRWIGIGARNTPRAVVWEMSARSHPPVGEAERRAWCGAIGALMADAAPSQPWRARFVQRDRVLRCDD